VHFYRILQNVDRGQFKCSGSLIGTDDVTAARRSAPFSRCLYYIYMHVSLACVTRVWGTRTRKIRSPPHLCRFSVRTTSSRLETLYGSRIWMFPFARVLHQGGMRLTVRALVSRVCRVGWSVNGARRSLHPSPCSRSPAVSTVTGASPGVPRLWWRRHPSRTMWTGGPSEEPDPRATHRTWTKPGCPTHYRQVSARVQ